MANDISKDKRDSFVNHAILKEIAAGLSSLKYGDIVIKVHDSRIIQVERTEKKRYDNYRGMEQGCGI